MTKQRGNPIFHLRLSPERRKLWEEAARKEQRTLSDFIKVAMDEKASVVLENNVYRDTMPTIGRDLKKIATSVLSSRLDLLDEITQKRTLMIGKESEEIRLIELELMRRKNRKDD